MLIRSNKGESCLSEREISGHEKAHEREGVRTRELPNSSLGSIPIICYIQHHGRRPEEGSFVEFVRHGCFLTHGGHMDGWMMDGWMNDPSRYFLLTPPDANTPTNDCCYNSRQRWFQSLLMKLFALRLTALHACCLWPLIRKKQLVEYRCNKNRWMESTQHPGGQKMQGKRGVRERAAPHHNNR